MACEKQNKEVLHQAYLDSVRAQQAHKQQCNVCGGRARGFYCTEYIQLLDVVISTYYALEEVCHEGGD